MIILDTNVVVSGVLSWHRKTPPAELLDEALSGRIALLASPALLAEWQRTLARVVGVDPVLDPHGKIVEGLAARARIRAPVSGPPAPDRRDDHLWALLAAEPASLLVTGERALLASEDFPGRVFAPRLMWDRLRGRTER